MNIWIVITVVAALIAVGSFCFVRKVLLASVLASIVTAAAFMMAMGISGEKFAVIGGLSVLLAAVPISLLVTVVCAKIMRYRQQQGGSSS